MLRLLWSEPVVSFDGSFHHLDRVGINPLPDAHDPDLRRDRAVPTRCCAGSCARATAGCRCCIPGLDRIPVADGRGAAAPAVRGGRPRSGDAARSTGASTSATGWQRQVDEALELGFADLSFGFNRLANPGRHARRAPRRGHRGQARARPARRMTSHDVACQRIGQNPPSTEGECTMTDKAHAELLDDVLSRHEGSPNARLREITEAAIRHLHAFVEEVNLQRDEWFAGIQFLTAIGQKCDDRRQEFILLSDTLGVSTLVEMVTYDGVEGSTENTVLGPFYVPGSPPRAKGETMLVDPDEGDRVVIRGAVTDVDGQPDRRRDARLLAERHRRLLRRAAARRAVGREPARHLHHRRRRHLRDPHRAPRALPDPVRRAGRRHAQGPRAGLDAARAHPHAGAGRRATRTSSPTCSTSRPTTCATTRCSGCATASSARFEPDENGELATTFDIVLDRAGPSGAHSATTGLVRVPIPVMVTSTVSPGCNRIGGVRA